MKWFLLINLASTLILCGIIWTIQIVHYPLFSLVGSEAFPGYESAHISRITLLVMPVMLIEGATALLLALSPPDGIPSWLLWLGIVLIGIVWLLTLFVNTPQHNVLSRGYSESVHNALLLSNWLRTAMWSIRGLLMLSITARIMI